MVGQKLQIIDSNLTKLWTCQAKIPNGLILLSIGSLRFKMHQWKSLEQFLFCRQEASFGTYQPINVKDHFQNQITGWEIVKFLIFKFVNVWGRYLPNDLCLSQDSYLLVWALLKTLMFLSLRLWSRSGCFLRFLNSDWSD